MGPQCTGVLAWTHTHTHTHTHTQRYFSHTADDMYPNILELVIGHLGCSINTRLDSHYSPPQCTASSQKFNLINSHSAIYALSHWKICCIEKNVDLLKAIKKLHNLSHQFSVIICTWPMSAAGIRVTRITYITHCSRIVNLLQSLPPYENYFIKNTILGIKL